MKSIPAPFLQRMHSLLGDEFPAFQQCYTQPAVTGLRANTLKITSQALQARLAYRLEPLPWADAGFWLPGDQPPDAPPPGKNPDHAAGLYYLQDPSAMAVVELLDPQPGERILDLCAAPGGKATHIAARMNHQGVLVANENHPRRVWELAENLERWGARNAAITQESAGNLADALEGFFDRVLVDAPCSGEGMLRKSEAARQEWSPGLIQSCALRQSSILDEAVRLVRPGGRLVYSTCTFNPQENEDVLAGLLRRHPQLELLKAQDIPGFSPGRPEWSESQDSRLTRAVRLWPHLAPGEGHFIAVMQRAESSIAAGTRRRANAARLHAKNSRRAWPSAAFQAFCQANLSPSGTEWVADSAHWLAQVGDYLYAIPQGLPDMRHLRTIHPGWWLGRFHGGRTSPRFEPSHALAMSLHLGHALRSLDLDRCGLAARSYLRGEILDWQGEDGWTLVTVDGYPLGWGKASQNRLKNAYPRGLRWP